MSIFKFYINCLLTIGVVFANSQKISIGAIKSVGITNNEVEELKQQIDDKIQSTDGFVLTNYKSVYKNLNEDSPDLLDCINLACNHEIAHTFGLNAVISGEVIFHDNGVNIKMNIFSHWQEKFTSVINEEHAPLKFSAVKELITTNYIPELLNSYSILVKPSIEIIEPNKFYTILEKNNLNILLNLSDNSGLKNYLVSYSKDGGQSFKNVQSGELNNQLKLSALAISIPIVEGITDKGMVQISVADIDGNISVRSSELFTVMDNTPPSVSISSPAKSEILKGSNQYNISWQGNDNLGITTYELFYSTDNGNSYTSIVTLNGTYSNFIWNVPDLLTNSCFIKIKAVDYTGLNSEASIGPISVMDGKKPSFTIMTKLKGKSYLENTLFETVLNLRDNTGVKIVEAYFTDDNVNFKLLSQTIFDNLINNENSNFKFYLPYGVTSNAQIKWVVRDLFENETSLLTDKFTLKDNSPPINEIIYPVKGVRFKGLDQGKIIWSASDNTKIASHEIFYSLNNGKSWLYIGKSGGDKNNIIWDVPDINTTMAKLKLITKDITGLSTESISDIFEIKDVIKPTIDLAQPKNFSQYRERDSIKIKINLKDNIGLHNSQVYLRIGAQSQSLSDIIYPGNKKTDTIYISQLLNASPNDDISLIIISTDKAGNKTNFTSDSFNLIDNTPPSISFKTNISGEKIDGKSKFKLNWSTRDNVGIKKIKLELTDDGGKSWKNIKTFYSKVEEYLWHVPNLHSNQCKIKISAVDVNDFSSEFISSNFSINDKTGPKLEVLNPKINQSYRENEIIDVSIFARDDYGLGLIEIYYSSDGYNFKYISNEAFTHDITQDTISFTVKIKEGLSQKSLFKFIGLDRFNNESEIVSPTFKVTDNTPPNINFTLNLNTREFATGKAYNIDWSGNDNFNLKNTQLEYSTDNGLTWTNLFSTNLNGKEIKQTYTWLIPLDLKSPCKLKASITDEMDLSASTVFTDFIIIDQTNPKIKFKSYPLKFVNETQNFKLDLILTDNYELNSIDFYYSKNLNDFNYLSSVSSLSGKSQEISYELTIPKGFTKSAIIKIVLTDRSGNTFTKFTETFEVIDFTNPNILLISNIPKILINKEQLNLSWISSDNESLNSHIIELSNDLGNNWSELCRLPGSQVEWTWDVPDIISKKNSKLRIITIDHVNLTDTITTNLFSIKDETNPKLFIPTSKRFNIEVRENDTLYQSFEISDNYQIKSLKVEYSNIPRQFKLITDMDFEIEKISSKSLKIGIPIPPGATKNAKLKATLTDISGNTVNESLKGIRVLDNTPPVVKFIEPSPTKNLDSVSVLVVGDTLWFQWESKDNTGIRSNRISYKLADTDYWQPILTTRGDNSSLSWTIPEKAVGKCEFEIIATDKVGLQSKHVVGPFKIQDILNESRQNLLRKYGSILIESNPSGAMVIVDNIEKGYTPLRIENLSEGNHRLILFKRKFKHLSKIIEIKSDSIFTLNEILEEKE